MDSVTQKPHAVCIPFPAQSHIKAMLKLAKLLHSQGIQITFVNTEYNHKRFLKSGGPDALAGLPDFRFATIPDGLPSSDTDATQDLLALCESIPVNCFDPFLGLLEKIPPVTCIVSDAVMSAFTIDAGEKLGVPVVLFWTVAACLLMGFCQFRDLREKGFTPLKDANYLTNGFVDIDPDDPFLNFSLEIITRSIKASANIIHTFDELEADIVSSLSSMIPQVYAIGPLQLLLNKVPKEEHLTSIGYSLWKEEHLCLEWLDSREPSSVLYVNFGSVAVLSSEKVVEFALGLANSGQDFLWIIRPDLIVGESAISLTEILEGTKHRGFTTSWCPQEQVLNHPSVGGFLTHCGWNSIIESLSAGVPMICLPFLGDQLTNCRYTCNDWEVGLKIDTDFKKDDVEKVVRELMEGEKGKKMKKKAVEWKDKAEKATGTNGSSSINLDMLVKELFFSPLEKEDCFEL